MSIEIDEEVWAKVRYAFAEALGLEEDEVELDQLIIADLEAESLDFLDIAFRLERAFDIKIPRGGIEKEAQDAGGVDEDGCLTADGVQRLREAMPEVPPEEIQVGMSTSQIPETFRVATFYSLVVKLIAEKASA